MSAGTGVGQLPAPKVPRAQPKAVEVLDHKSLAPISSPIHQGSLALLLRVQQTAMHTKLTSPVFSAPVLPLPTFL